MTLPVDVEFAMLPESISAAIPPICAPLAVTVPEKVAFEIAQLDIDPTIPPILFTPFTVPEKVTLLIDEQANILPINPPLLLELGEFTVAELLQLLMTADA
jgi:hypothetical protein